MTIDMDSEDAPWNGPVWKVNMQTIESAIELHAKSTDAFDVGYTFALIAAMNTFSSALRTDWYIKALERKIEERE